MAHKYSNFSAAYYSYGAYWDAAKLIYNSLLVEQANATNDFLAGLDHNAIGHLCNCVYDIQVIFQFMFGLDATAKDQSDFMECLYWAAREPTSAVDMAAIINAMLAATFNQLQYFIGIEDAYRVALWNAPFNADFYAALARGFQKWP